LTRDRVSITKEVVTDLAALVRRLDELERGQAETLRALEATATERDAFRQLYLETLERCRKLELGLVGQRREKVADESQLAFDVIAGMLGQREADEIAELPTKVREHERKKHPGRKPLPEHLPRVDIEIVPDEVKREGLDAFERIGEEITEVLERRSAAMVVARVIKPKFKRRGDPEEKTEILVGATPQLPIERGLAGPGLLADTIVKRWQDHLPLNRQEQAYAREGVELSRSTMCTWHMTLAELAQPLVSAMRDDAFNAPYLCTDATGVLVQAKDKCRRGHFWVLVVPGRHVLFEYTRNHTSSAVDSVLAGYEGFLVADAHSVYDHLYASDKVTEVNCWAHARRYFFKAMSSDPERARVALGLMGMLFKIERSIATAPRKKRERIRAKHSAPVVERFYSWCDDEWPKLIEGTPIYDGVRYARNQRVGLQRFLEDGRLPLHNNMSELELRRQAVGRKNWIFVGSDDGARANTVFTSLLASCRMNGVEPWSYLRDILCLLPDWKPHRLLELAPVNWSETVTSDEVQTVLAANPYRALTIER